MPQNTLTFVEGLVETAKAACAHGFSGADILSHAVEEAIKLLGKDHYEEVTSKKLGGIKVAIVRGPDGIVTQTGH